MDLVWIWQTGPDAGGVHRLAPGRSIVGRAGHITCDDPRLLAHHALLEFVGERVLLTQLCGSADIEIDGRPVVGCTEFTVGARLSIAGSTATIERPTTPAAHAVVDDTGRLVRTPRRPPPVPTPPPALDVREPPERERPGGLVPALVGLTGSAVMAVVADQPMFLVVGALGASVGVASWVSQSLAYQRRHARAVAEYRRRIDDHRRALDVFGAAHRDWCRTVTPGIGATLWAARGPTVDLWSRRPDHGDAHCVALGIGPAVVHDLTLDGLPATVDLGPHSRLACCGSDALALTRSLLCQLITQCGPADVRLVVATRHPDRWAWLAAAPHTRAADATTSVVVPEMVDTAVTGLCDADPSLHIVIVTDDAAALAERTTSLRRTIDATRHALLAVLEADPPPHICHTVVDTGTERTGRLESGVLIAGLSERSAQIVTAALAGLVDPEDRIADAARLPNEVDLTDLVGPISPGVIRDEWATLHRGAVASIGRTVDSVVAVDLTADGPHALVAGTTGSGKSELLRSLVLGLAVRYPADEMTFILVDFKGGATFDCCARLPHVVGVVTDLDDDLADRVLRSLHAELRRRETVLRVDGATDLAALRASGTTTALPRLLVIVDEFAALATERPGFLHALVDVARRGRSLGLHLVLATQRPAGVISDDIRANTSLRIALRLNDVTDALDVISDRRPATFSRTLPGRALVGLDQPLVVQTARCRRPELVVEAVCAAHRADRRANPTPPWRPPLPNIIDVSTCALLAETAGTTAVGVLDDPDRQTILPLTWSPGDGALLIVGSDRTATSGAALAVVAAVASRHCVHVVDGTDDARWDEWAAHPAIDVIRPGDDGRLGRLQREMSSPEFDAVVVVDGLDRLRRHLDVAAHDHRPGHRHDTRFELFVAAIDHLLAGGGRVVVTSTSVQALPTAWLAHLAHRWILHLTDPHEAAGAGVPATLVPPAIAGRVRVGPLLGQLAVAQPPHDDGAAPQIVPTPAAPTFVDVHSLTPPTMIGRVTRLSIGIDVTTGREVAIDIAPDDSVLVLGPPRSGRTATLDLIATLLGDRGPVVVIDDAEFAEAPPATAAVLVVAARVDALGGRHGHWVDTLRRSRTGIVLASGDTTLEADYLGRVLPQRFPVTPRPGSAWIVDGAQVTPAQLAHPPTT